MPEDLHGDLLFAEPVGRLIRRAKIVKTEGLTQLRNAYPGSEFILGTDPLFRPVNMRTAPDGTVYIADMYHGIIQEAQWTAGRHRTCGRRSSSTSSTRSSTHGRIWRLRFDGTPECRHADGPAAGGDSGRRRFRDRARLHQPRDARRDAGAAGRAPDAPERLVARHGAAAARPEAGQVRRAGAADDGRASSDNLVARFHALWTLEGLGALDAALVRET